MKEENGLPDVSRRKARSAPEEAARLEGKLTRLMMRFTEVGGDRLVFSAPSFVPLLLRDLASMADDPGSVSATERARLGRVARAAADLLDRHQDV